MRQFVTALLHDLTVHHDMDTVQFDVVQDAMVWSMVFIWVAGVYSIMAELEADGEAETWMENAEADLETATILVDADDTDAALFHMHQSVEKALKAVQIHRQGDHELSHDLVRLGEDTGVPDTYRRLLARLNPVYTGFRYPDEQTPNIDNADQILEHVAEVIAWTQKQLNKQEP